MDRRHQTARLHPERDPLEDVIQRVWRRFENEVAEDAQGTPETARRRVGGWLAGVSFDEWFALVEAYREAQGV